MKEGKRSHCQDSKGLDISVMYTVDKPQLSINDLDGGGRASIPFSKVLVVLWRKMCSPPLNYDRYNSKMDLQGEKD